MGFLILLLVVGTTIWVGVDAHKLGVRRGSLPGSFCDLSVASWVICCLLLWVLVFPLYLVIRPRYVAAQHPRWPLSHGPTSSPPSYAAGWPASTSMGGSPGPVAVGGRIAKLQQLDQLRQTGALTAEEFAMLKADVLTEP